MNGVTEPCQSECLAPHRASFTDQRVIDNFLMASDRDSVSGLSLPDISVACDTADCGILPQTITH